MRISMRWTMAAVMAVGLVSVTVAQQQPRPGGGFPGGGGFGGQDLTSLIRSKTVREDIKVSEEQGKKLVEWNKEFGPKLKEMRETKFKEISKDLSREERGKKFAEINAEIVKETEKELATVLQSEQVKRLKQIQTQLSFGGPLSRPDVVEALKIADDQKEKLTKIGEDSRKASSDLREALGIRGFGGPRLEEAKQKEYDEKAAAIRKETDEKRTAVLNDEQKAKLKELVGAPIDTAKVRQETTPAGGPGQPGGNRPRTRTNANQ